MNLKIMTYQVPPYGGSAINTQRRGRADGERYQCLVPGNEKKLEKMKNWYWLKNVGSPRSRILIKCEIKNIQKQVERGIVGAHFFFLQRNINSKVPTQYKLTL